MQTSKQTINSLQTVRALAFLGIFTSHCAVSQYGPWGVSVFLVLSGFVMVYSYYDREIGYTFRASFSFSIKKIKKLYWLYILMTAAALGLEIPFIIHNFSIGGLIKHWAPLILSNLLLVQAWFPDTGIYFSLNSVAWYLSVCAFLYFLFPFVLSKIKKIKSIKQE